MCDAFASVCDATSSACIAVYLDVQRASDCVMCSTYNICELTMHAIAIAMTTLVNNRARRTEKHAIDLTVIMRVTGSVCTNGGVIDSRGVYAGIMVRVSLSCRMYDVIEEHAA